MEKTSAVVSGLISFGTNDSGQSRSVQFNGHRETSSSNLNFITSAQNPIFCDWSLGKGVSVRSEVVHKSNGHHSTKAKAKTGSGDRSTIPMKSIQSLIKHSTVIINISPSNMKSC